MKLRSFLIRTIKKNLKRTRKTVLKKQIKKLFTGIYGHAGKLRDYNITKKEWVLDGATVLYGRYMYLEKEIQELRQCFLLNT